MVEGKDGVEGPGEKEVKYLKLAACVILRLVLERKGFLDKFQIVCINDGFDMMQKC